MAKFKIERTEAIPFREINGDVMQMKQYEVSVTVTQDEGETVANIEEQLDIVFARNLEKTMLKDPVYQRQKKQLNFLVEQLKKLVPTRAKEVILAAKKIKND